MSINRQRLLNLIESNGFTIAWSGGSQGGAEYARSSAIPELSEAIFYRFAGKEREAVTAHVRVFVWSGFPSIGEDRHIPDLETVPGRGYAIITTDLEAIAWERRLAKVGPARAAEFAQEVGPGLLDRTRGAREATRAYLAAVEESGGWDAFKRAATPSRIEAAERVAESSLVTIPDAQDLYHAASLAIVSFRDTVEKDDATLREMNPMRNTELAWRIDLLVNRLNNAKSADGER